MHNAGHKQRFAKLRLAGQMDGWMGGYTTLAVYFNVLGQQSCYEEVESLGYKFKTVM